MAPIVITLGFAYLPTLGREATRALIGHVSSLRHRNLDLNSVRRYFETRSANNSDQLTDMIASSSIAYQTLLGSVPLLNHELSCLSDHDTILDWGCGTGSLLEWLRSQGVSSKYLGYEIDNVRVERLSRQHSSADVRFTSDQPKDLARIAFLINVLPYVNDGELENVVSQCLSNLIPGGALVCVEPWPAWYWENKFDGLRLRLRTQDEIALLFRSLSLTFEVEAHLAVSSIASRRILPISQLSLWRKP